MWSVCCPTDTHLSTVRTLLERDPRARVLLEKPACRSGEIEEFTELLAAHPQARLVLVDQYRYSKAPAVLAELLALSTAAAPIDQQHRHHLHQGPPHRHRPGPVRRSGLRRPRLRMAAHPGSPAHTHRSGGLPRICHRRSHLRAADPAP
ncbi:hypothetical protein [Kitasatospora sp. GAS206B]|uniref:hypothetical protein n=1 Tax=unclassified Kitasatospora TaxID=2633591 RepID=UPI0035135552